MITPTCDGKANVFSMRRISMCRTWMYMYALLADKSKAK